MSTWWKGRRVLVTGATGLLGSWLSKALVERQASVTALVRDADPQSEFFRSRIVEQIGVVSGELEDLRALERAINQYEIDTVFHLGAQTIVTAADRAPLATFESNIRGTYNLLEACRRYRDLVQRVVVASSDKAYGQQQEAYREDMPLDGRRPYEVSKVCAEMLAVSYHRTYELPVAMSRCGNLYGGGDLNWSRLIPGTIRSLVAGERPIIRSNGQFIRDYLYVEDAVEALLRLAEQLHQPGVRGQSFNFSAEQPRTVLEMVRLIQRLMGSETLEPVILNEAPGELITQTLSTRKANEMLEWQPRWELEDALTKTIHWYRSLLIPATVVP